MEGEAWKSTLVCHADTSESYANKSGVDAGCKAGFPGS